MTKESQSDLETDENSEKSSSDEQENVQNDENEGVTEYEMQRLERIKENKARLEALRLPSLASKLLGSVEKKGKRKGKEKKKEDDDEEYRPSDGEEKMGFSSEEDVKGEEDEEFGEWSDGSPCSSKGSACKGKMRQSLAKSKSKKKVPLQKHVRKLDFIDDDAALEKAIALSLGGSSEISGAVLCEQSQNCRADVADVELKEGKRRPLVQETDRRKKKGRSNASRVQITEDQVIIHFFQFDEAGKGGITVKDLQRVAVDHDFTWSDKEMADMIHLFDTDGNGRLNLDDFRKILQQCNMIKG